MTRSNRNGRRHQKINRLKNMLRYADIYTVLNAFKRWRALFALDDKQLRHSGRAGEMLPVFGKAKV